MTVKILLTLAFLLLTVAVGIYSRRHSRSVDGFVLGGRDVGAWLSAFAYGTSYFSAVVFVGYAGQFGWKYGLSSTWIGIGNAVLGSALAWMALARRTRIMTRHIGSRTMPDFFGTRYNSDSLRVAASIIAFVFLIPYTAGVYMGIAKLFETGFGVSYACCAWTMAALTAVYVILGGYKATAINDFIQGMVMLAGIATVAAVVLNHQGGLAAAVAKMGEVAPNADDLAQRGAEVYARFAPGDFAGWFGPDPAGLLGVVLLTSLGTWGLPQMVGKFYSISDDAAIRRGTVISTVFAAVVAGGCYFLGGFGRLFVPTAFDHGTGRFAFDSIVPKMLEVSLPDALMALVLLLVLSASMSTLASLVLTSSSTMTLDLIYRDRTPGPDEVREGRIDAAVALRREKRKVVVMRVLIVFFIVISLMIALNPPNFIAQLMGISWGALAGAFLAPFLLGLYSRRITPGAVWCCFVWGVGITLANMLAGNPVNPISCGALAMVGGFGVTALASFVTPRMDRAWVDRIFECYGKAVGRAGAGRAVKGLALFATLSVAAAATAHGGATDAQDPVVEAEEWNYGVRCYRAGDTTNALGVFERLQDSRRRGERAAALVAKLEYDAAMADGETNGLDHLERAATAAQRVWRARPHDGRARDNYARATSGLADLRRRRREAEALARLGGIPPENAVERLLAHARANCAAVSNLPPAAAIADAEARAARARELADGYIAIREQLRQALTNEADISVIERQTNAARENALRAARDFEDLAAGAINCAMAAEADATAWHKELCDPRAAIGAAIECETNAIAGATERYSRSTTRDALDYVEGFRRRLPAWAENYRQRAAADTNLPPFTAEAQAEADKLAAALSEQLSRLVENFDVGEACAAESSMRRIARLIPEEKPPQSPPQQQPQPPQQQSAQAQSGNAGESKDDGEDSKQEGAQESQSPEGGEDQREKPSAAPPEPQPAPDEKELEDALKSARERSDEHRERQGKRSRGALPGERDW